MSMVTEDRLLQIVPALAGHPGPLARARARWRQRETEWAQLSLSDRRLGMVRAVAVLVWLCIPAFLLSHPMNGLNPLVEWPGTRLVWTLVVALLPVTMVIVGYYTWRQVCPLMFFARMSEWIGWPDQRTTPARERRRRFVPAWVARHYPYLSGTFLFLMLVLRILVINSDAVVLGWTFIGLGLLAMLSGFIYTGKAWCNFFCPVSMVEKIYTDADRPQWRQNSQCPTCTRCKTELTRGLCPDINQENDYWQELQNGGRSFAYYSFPGLVLGFYTWYFLHLPDYWNSRGPATAPGHELRGQDGVLDWGFYLSGDWTRVADPWKHLMDRGFGFSWAPPIPTVLAAH